MMILNLSALYFTESKGSNKHHVKKFQNNKFILYTIYTHYEYIITMLICTRGMCHIKL